MDPNYTWRTILDFIINIGEAVKAKEGTTLTPFERRGVSLQSLVLTKHNRGPAQWKAIYDEANKLIDDMGASEGEDTKIEQDVFEFAALVNNLFAWLLDGGFKPKTWT